MSRPASLTAATLAQASMELRLTARRGENVLVTIVIPVVVLLFFAGTGVVQTGAQDPVDFLLPGALALAVIATSLVNLGIATAYERNYGVLKRLGGSPLTRGGLLTAKMGIVLIVEVAQVVLLVAVAIAALGWSAGPGVSPAAFVVSLLLGTAAFAGLGLLMAGALRAEATLALANGLFIAFIAFGGIVLSVSHLPEPLATIAPWLPAGGPRRRVPCCARGGRCRPRPLAGSPRGLGRGHGRAGGPDVPLGVAVAYSDASGRSRRRSTGDPIRNRTPPMPAIVVTRIASRTPSAVPSTPPSSAPIGLTP